MIVLRRTQTVAEAQRPVARGTTSLSAKWRRCTDKSQAITGLVCILVEIIPQPTQQSLYFSQLYCSIRSSEKIHGISNTRPMGLAYCINAKT